MKNVYTKNQIELVEAIVGLFIIFPNPELKHRKNEIMKIAFDVFERTPIIEYDDDDDDDDYDDYDQYLDECCGDDYYKYLAKSDN